MFFEYDHKKINFPPVDCFECYTLGLQTSQLWFVVKHNVFYLENYDKCKIHICPSSTITARVVVIGGIENSPLFCPIRSEPSPHTSRIPVRHSASSETPPANHRKSSSNSTVSSRDKDKSATIKVWKLLRPGLHRHLSLSGTYTLPPIAADEHKW